MQVQQFVNSIFTSNTYLINFDDNKIAWCIDPGDSAPLLEWLSNNNQSLNGIFLTHAHFDHIYGINDLLAVFPEIPIYVSESGAEALVNDKLNGSRYSEMPFVVKYNRIEIVGEDSRIELAENRIMEVWTTPGHTCDSISFYTPGMVFTGDALIPGIKTRTKTKTGNKEQSTKSIHKILSRIHEDTIIYPGHKENCCRKDCKIVI
jgi:glyoxylase-like metal-dependent hydrolase (beta-lactamase superfamily II)